MENTSGLVQSAQNRKYTEFDVQTKDILANKVATKLKEQGYFDRLDAAQAVSEASLNEDKAAYKKVFDAELAKFDAKSPAGLSTADKKKFFDAVDAAYEGENEND